MDKEELKIAPISYQNWIQTRGLSDELDTWEYLLFTDAHLIGDTIIFGPYKLINTVAIGANWNRTYRNRVMDNPIMAEDVECLPALALQITYYPIIDTNKINPHKKNDANYYGGALEDEFGALISLCLGIRLQAGGATRRFSKNQDKKGRPIAYELRKNASLPLASHIKNPVGHTIIPNLVKQCHIEQDLELLNSFPNLSPKVAHTLMTAARLYQNAIWISDNSPELSWLFLVSAIEAVATEWKTAKISLAQLLHEFEPELIADLKEHAKESESEILIEKVAKRIASVKRVKKKFISFILEFLPSPPSSRPPELYQHEWSGDAFEKSLKLIYNYRSSVLHDGKPIPAPMCQSPDRVENKYAEIHTASAIIDGGWVWRKEDLPMTLNTFEYIVRGSILNWWKSLVDEE